MFSTNQAHIQEIMQKFKNVWRGRICPNVDFSTQKVRVLDLMEEFVNI